MFCGRENYVFSILQLPYNEYEALRYNCYNYFCVVFFVNSFIKILLYYYI